MAAPRPNDPEWRRWNDDRWTTAWPRREQLTEAVTPFLMEKAQLRAGERVLDVGAGGGPSSLAAARLVGSEGEVVAVDLSDALIVLARDRAERAGFTTVRFVRADAQTDRMGPVPFDAVLSQFGVMFFDEPVRAFTNLRAQLRPGGRLVFACWQEASANPWHASGPLRRFGPPGAPRSGPFSLGDWAETEALLASAGFAGITRDDHQMLVEATLDAVFDRSQLPFFGVAPGREEDAEAAVHQHLAQFWVSRDRYRYPLAFRIVAARNPG